MPNLRWYCLPCDKHQTTIIKNFKEGVVAYQSTGPTTSTPKQSAGRCQKQQQNESPLTDEIVKILSEFSNRIDSHELLIGELGNMMRENINKESYRADKHVAPPSQASVHGAHGSRSQNQTPAVQNNKPAPQQTQANGQTSNPNRLNLSAQSNRTVTFADALQANVSQSRQNLAPTGNSASTVRHRQPVASRVASSADQGGTTRRLVLTPAAANVEIEEIEKRKNNIVIHNLPEQEAENKQEADMEEINFMLSKGMLLTDITAESTKRLGALRADGRPRSFLVKLNQFLSEYALFWGDI